MTAATLRGIFRYPVKSMAGESLRQARIEGRGIPGDRAWAVRDEQRGGIRGAKRFPPLMRCAARYPTDAPVEGTIPAIVTLPDGRELAINDAAMADALSTLVDGPVSVWPLMPDDMLDHYRRGAPVLDDMEAELRSIFGRTADEPLPDLSTFPAQLLEFESPPGTYFDAFPLLVMTTSGLEHLQSLAADYQFDIRRFRPNLLIETSSEDPFPERAWVGRTLQLGTAQLEITMECPRCSMTTHGFADLPREPGIMRTLVQHAGGNLGVYANVTVAGQVSTEDPVHVV